MSLSARVLRPAHLLGACLAAAALAGPITATPVNADVLAAAAVAPLPAQPPADGSGEDDCATAGCAPVRAQ